ncbi:unnamed protein product [Mucor hiemalis]
MKNKVKLDNLVEQLQLNTTTEMVALYALIDERKRKESNKHSKMYLVLNTVNYVVHGFHFWKNASAKYKSVSLPTKDALQSKIYGDDLNDFDKRTDLTVSCRELDTAIELCCVKSLKTRRTQSYHRHSTTKQK